MKKILVEIKDGKIDMEFDDFPDKTCSDEEDVIRTLYGKMGVKNNVEYSDNKRATEASGIAKREALRQ